MSLPPAAAAFDAVAERFDARYGGWKSVAAQRRAVRAALIEAFAPGARILEIGEIGRASCRERVSVLV